MNRYDTDSTCCGALGALLAGTRHPAMDEIRMAFSYDDVPRLDMLRDPTYDRAAAASFVAAIVNARLQARSAIVDIQDYVSHHSNRDRRRAHGHHQPSHNVIRNSSSDSTGPIRARGWAKPSMSAWVTIPASM